MRSRASGTTAASLAALLLGARYGRLATSQLRTITGLPYQPEVNPYVLVANGVMWLSDRKDNLVLRVKP